MMDHKILSARCIARNHSENALPLDRIFVRDLVLDCEIGVFDNEKGRTQRVGFTVDLEVLSNVAYLEDDIDRVISYDVIVDGIKDILRGGHIHLVETLAERIADHCLSDPRSVRVMIRIEKLDKEAAAVGVEIMRQAPPLESANVYRLWTHDGN